MGAGDPKPAKRDGRTWVTVLGYGATSTSFVAIFTAAGIWLDLKCETLPLFIILGFLLGIAGAAYEIWKMLHSLGRSASNQDETLPTDDS